MRWKGLVAAAASVLAVLAASGTAGAAARHSTSVPDFGPNVKIFDPSMSTADIAAQLNAVATQQVSNEFGTQRYAFLFMPGTYGSAADPLNTQVGYYTQIAGLGRSPDDVDV